VAAALLGAGCRSSGNPTPGSPEAGAKTAPARPRARPSRIEGRARPIEAIKLCPLAAAVAREVVDRLIQAHYDPEALGLEELAFEATLELHKTKTKAHATGSWRKGAAPELELVRVDRKGMSESAPSDPGVGQQIWTSLRLQLQNLLEGLGRGFLSQRLAAWRRLEGRTALKGDKLELAFSDEGGENEVTIGEGWVVERVVSRSPKKATRSMAYAAEREGGRNLVTRALFRAQVEPGSELPSRAVKVLEAQDGMRFEIGYGTFGGYRLPTRLRKVSPRTDEVVEVSLRYTGLR
jgi:hypothetical protein